MNKIRIITDSAADLCGDLPPRLTVLPMTISFGEESFLDGVTISHREFYERLVESDKLPVTSLVSPAAFEEAYRQAVEDGETVVAITISSKLSGTYQSAVLAAEEFPGRVFVVDSLNAAIGEQVLVRYALELAARGLDAAAIAETLERDRSKVHILALLDTLEYLKKGGRISSTVAFVGGMLSIKPVITLEDGEIKLLGTARGSKNGSNFLIREMEKAGGADFDRPLVLGYTGISDALLQKYIRDSRGLWEGHEDSLVLCTIGATIGTHVGPNAIAVAFFAP